MLPFNQVPPFINPSSIGNIGLIFADFEDHLYDLDANGQLPPSDNYTLYIPGIA